MTRKILALVLVLTVILSMTAAYASSTGPQNQDASFTKTYKLANAGTSNPAETFTFTFTPDKVTDSNSGLGKSDMPSIASATASFGAGTATTAKSVNVALSSVAWPGVGVYYYKVAETAGSTGGVTYDSTVADLKVTVAYDAGTGTYYTAFVTMSLADSDSDGITDTKTAGFTNVYSAGDLSVTKEVTGNMGDQSAYFDVTVSLTGVSGETYDTAGYAVQGGSNSSNPTSMAVGESKTFKLKHGETITFKNLPYGVTYTVSEADYTSAAAGGYDAPDYDFSDSGKEIDSALDTVKVTNNKGVVVDTGIALDDLPYILLLAAAVLTGVVMAIRRKRSDND